MRQCTLIVVHLQLDWALMNSPLPPVCPPNNQLFISDNRSLLPLENIQASSESPLYPTANIANSGWCTNAPSFIGEYVNFTFTQPVVLTMILSSSVFIGHYVNNFSIAYSPSEDGNGSFFDIYGVTSTPQVSCPILIIMFDLIIIILMYSFDRIFLSRLLTSDH